MKAVLLLLVFGAVTLSNAVDPKKIDWEEVKKDYDEIRNIVKATHAYLVEEATRGNAEVGAQLKTFIAEHRIDFLQKINGKTIDMEIAERTMTTDKVKAFFTQIETTSLEIEPKMNEIIAKLPKVNVDNIKQKFESADAQILDLRRRIEDIFRAAE